jgi:hypothetical protein
VGVEKSRLLASPVADPDLKAHISSEDPNQGIIHIRIMKNC